MVQLTSKIIMKRVFSSTEFEHEAHTAQSPVPADQAESKPHGVKSGKPEDLAPRSNRCKPDGTQTRSNLTKTPPKFRDLSRFENGPTQILQILQKIMSLINSTLFK